MEKRPTRRGINAGLAAGAFIVAFDPLTRTWADETSGLPRNVPPLDGRLLAEPRSRSEAADDFGHLIHRSPLAVLEPGSVDDIAAMVRFCREHGITAAARGQGHSTHGQAQVSKGLVIEMAPLRDIRVQEDSAVIQAGARWSEVLQATIPHGLAPPVHTDYLELSVGGTLAVGGIGGTTYRHGAQVDNALELEVVTGTGERTTCSPTHRADLFHAVLAGLGQCGIITCAKMRLLPAPPIVRHYELFYPNVKALTLDQRRLVRDGRFEFVQGQALAPENGNGWRYLLEAVTHNGSADDRSLLGDLNFQRGTEQIENLPYFDFLNRLAEAVELLKSIGEWARPHPWWNVLLPDTAADDFAESVMAALTPADIGTSGVILLYPLRRAHLRTRLLRAPDQDLIFLFALLKTSSPGARTPEEMLAANQTLYRQARAQGGFQYPVGSIPMTHNDWRTHYGPLWPTFEAAKNRYDPSHILTPGQGIFRSVP